MSTLANLLLIRGFARALINGRDLSRAAEFCSEGSIHHEIADPSAGETGPRAMARFLAPYLRAFSDLRIVFLDARAAGADQVVTRWRFEGTHDGPLFDLPASGRQVSVEGIRIDRVAAGRIVESWMQWDTLGLLEQVGALPVPHRTLGGLLRPRREPAGAAPPVPPPLPFRARPASASPGLHSDPARSDSCGPLR